MGIVFIWSRYIISVPLNILLQLTAEVQLTAVAWNFQSSNGNIESGILDGGVQGARAPHIFMQAMCVE